MTQSGRYRSFRQAFDPPPSGPTRTDGWYLGLPAALGELRDEPLVIAGGGGKGGVGKTVVSANLGAQLARVAGPTLLVDLDIGGANLHTHFGIQFPACSLTDYLHGRVPLGDIILRPGWPGLGLIAAGREDVAAMAGALDGRLFEFCRELLLRARKLGYRIVLFDLGAGSHRETLDVFCAAHIGLLTVLPEPTSIENAYVFLKGFLARLIDHVAARQGAASQAEALKDALGVHAPPAPRHTLRGRLSGLHHRFPSLIDGVRQAIAARRTEIIINQCRSLRDEDIGRSMAEVAGQYFGLNSHSAGALHHEDLVWKSLMNRRLLAEDFPHSKLVQALGRIAKSLAGPKRAGHRSAAIAPPMRGRYAYEPR